MRAPLRVLDLFSGIGGFSFGLERAGFQTVAFCEIEPYCRRVLAKHWPHVPCYDDVRTLTAERLSADGISVDAICGGFPCQDISTAGKGAGIEGARSGLWKEYSRLIGELRPRYVIVENVAALLGRGLDIVLGDLAALGYDAEWHCIPASAVGAPHIRDRIWIIAYPQHSNPDSERPHRTQIDFNRSFELCHQQISEPRQICENVADASVLLGNERGDYGRRNSESGPEISELRNGGYFGDVSDAMRTGLSQRDVRGEFAPTRGRIFQGCELERAYAEIGGGQWRTEPNVGQVAHGIPSRVDRLRGLGNAVVPQIPELIGRAILASVGA